MTLKKRTKSAARSARVSSELRKSDATRARILEAANRVLGKKGYWETRMADIAKAAKTQAGAMYYYFPSKDALVEELMHRNVTRSQQISEQRIAAMPPHASYRDKLLTIVRNSLANLLGEDIDEMVVYIRLLNEVPPAIRTRMLGHAIESRHFVKALITDGQAAGEFSPDINPTVTALMLLSNLVWSHDWFKLSAHHTIDELARDICEILLTGIERRDGRPKPGQKRSARQ